MEKQTGAIEVVYVYYYSGEGGNIDPQCVDGFMLKVDLPFDETKSINSFIKTSATGKYLHKHWVHKMPLWVRTGARMIEKDRHEFDSKQPGGGRLNKQWEESGDKNEDIPIRASYIYVVSLQ